MTLFRITLQLQTTYWVVHKVRKYLNLPTLFSLIQLSLKLHTIRVVDNREVRTNSALNPFPSSGQVISPNLH